MDFRQLRYFHAVATHNGFSRAAARVHVVQSALSRHVRELEEDLGVELLVRRKRGVTLTEAGELLYRRADFLLNGLRQAEAEVRAVADAPAGELSLTVLPSVATDLIPPVAERFRTTFPNVKLAIRESYISMTEAELLQGQADLAVLYNVSARRELRTIPLIREELYLIECAGGRPRGRTLPAQLETLADVPLILPNAPTGVRKLVDDALAEHGLAARVTLEVDSLPAIKELVGKGLGSTVLPRSAVWRELRDGILREVPIADAPITRLLGIGRLEQWPLSRAGAELVGLVHEEIARLVAAGHWSGEIIEDGTAT